MTDVDIEIKLLRNEFNSEVEAINKAALNHQRTLKRRLNRSIQEERFNILGCTFKLEREIKRLEQERSRRQMRGSPIMSLPVELLSYIFQYHVDDGNSAWGLVKVCKDWMKIAFATPYLWRYICITHSLDLDQAIWEFDAERQAHKTNVQICRTVAQLQVALERSGAVPLEVHTKHSTWGFSVVRDISPLFCVLISAPVSERIGHLDLEGLSSARIALPANTQVGPFTRLTSMRLPHPIRPWVYPLLASISSTSTQLRTVELSGAPCQELAPFSFWSRIKRLELNMAMQLYNPGDLNYLVEQLVNLETIPDCPYMWPNEQTPISTWGHIKEITLRGKPIYFDRLRLPNIELLTFDDLYSRQDVADRTPVLSYPKLTTLVISTQDPRWFSNLSAPLLEQLTFSWTAEISRPEDTLISISTNLLSHITSIHLETPPDMGDTLVISALNNAPNLHTVEVLGRKGDTSFGLELLKRLDASQQPVLCPKLESLSLGTHSSPVHTLKKDAVPFIKRVVSSRKKAGIPLKEFSVYWQRGLTLDQYVYSLWL